MPLESGVYYPKMDSGKVRRLQLFQESLSFTEGVSIVAIYSDKNSLSSLIRECGQINASLIDEIFFSEEISFERLSEVIRSNWQILKPLMRDIEEHIYATSHSYLHPLFRVLRDHWVYRWFEAVLLCRFILGRREGDIIQVGFFDRDIITYKAVSVTTELVMIIGPIACIDFDRETAWQAFLSEIDSGVDQLYGEITQNWHIAGAVSFSSQKKNKELSSPIYSKEYIKRFSRSRQLANTGTIDYASEKIHCTVPAFLYFFESIPESLVISPQEMHKIIPIVFSYYDYLYIKKEWDKCICSEIHFSAENKAFYAVKYEFYFRNDRKLEIRETKNEPYKFDSETGYDLISMKIIDYMFTNMKNYHYESFIVLRNWLNHRFGYFNEDKTAGFFTQETAQDNVHGMRICRFISRLLLSDECTIYKVNQLESPKGLMRYGHFINREQSDQRSSLMAEHMKLIRTDNSERRKSITYRAFDKNSSEICSSIDASGHCISGPAGSEIADWGQSACAVPIRVNGVPWGVVELVGSERNGFSEHTLYHLQEISSIVSPFLYFHYAFDAMRAMGAVISNDSLTFAERKERIVKQMLNIFLCEGAAIIDVRQIEGRDGAGLSVFASQGPWWFDSSSPPKRLSINFPVSSDSNSYFMCEVGNSDFQETFGSIQMEKIQDIFGRKILIIALHSGKEEDKRLLLLMHNENIIHGEEFGKLFLFFSKYVNTIIEYLLSSESWEKILRNRLGHELNRIRRMIAASNGKLEKILLHPGRSENKKDFISAKKTLGDLSRATRSIDVYAKILSTGRDESARNEHPHIYIIRKEIQNYVPKAINLRSCYNGAFMALSDEFLARGITVDSFPKNAEFMVHGHEFLVSEVMEALAQNALKYALPRSSVMVKVKEYGNSLRLVVSNLGPSISREDKRRIFEEGCRGEYAHLFHSNDGSGIGLFYARQVMRISGDDIYHNTRELKAEDAIKMDGFDVVWHDFVLFFSRKIIK